MKVRNVFLSILTVILFIFFISPVLAKKDLSYSNNEFFSDDVLLNTMTVEDRVLLDKAKDDFVKEIIPNIDFIVLKKDDIAIKNNNDDIAIKGNNIVDPADIDLPLPQNNSTPLINRKGELYDFEAFEAGLNIRE